jgi:hypothetical protein
VNRSHLEVALLGALAATCGDLLLLYVGNSLRPELALPPAPAAVLWIGALLGVIGIPLYAIGYRAVARAFGAGLVSRLVVYPGLIAALGGAAIHGLTAIEIRRGIESGAPAAAPLEAIAASGGWLATLWSLVIAMFLIASVAFAWGRWRTAKGSARLAVLASPVLVAVVLMAVSGGNEWLRSFLAPAAPNAAHVVFFLVMWRLTDGSAR